jgi:hypothetical protein
MQEIKQVGSRLIVEMSKIQQSAYITSWKNSTSRMIYSGFIMLSKD